MTEAVFLEEGNLQTAALTLDGGNERVVRVPGNGGGEISTGRVIDITTMGEKGMLNEVAYEVETECNSFEKTRII